MGPETPLGEPKNKYMELGPRDKVSQASGTSGGTPSRRRAATWSTSISATSAKNYWSVCRLSVNWRKPTSASIR
ncbi:Fumarate reductase flavoprotein subunit [Klebsiella pneumoniae]|nr:Fumarate reductase flavoprotein subunit [Klebsiella pneumoniae]